jgi:hypothetical protein
MYVKRGRGRGRPPLASIDDSVVGVGIKSNIVIGISNDDDDDDCGGDDEVIDCSTGNVVGMIGDYVSSVLSLYKKDFGNIEFITGDNASVNNTHRRTAQSLDSPLFYQKATSKKWF